MSNVNASSRQNQSNIDDTQRDVVGPVYKARVKKRVIPRKNLGLDINSLRRFNYHFGGKI